jgi:hypothetical protein
MPAGSMTMDVIGKSAGFCNGPDLPELTSPGGAGIYLDVV